MDLFKCMVLERAIIVLLALVVKRMVSSRHRLHQYCHRR